LDELSRNVRILKAQIVVLTESKLDCTIPSSLISLPGFHEPLRRDRNRNGGGCLIYIAQTLTFKQQSHIQSEFYENISVDVRVNNIIYSINCLYRPPDFDNHEHFISETEGILARLSNHSAHTKLFMSDLNFGNIYSKYPALSPKPLDAHAPELFSSHGYQQLIDIPTRVTDNTTSLIDLAFTSNLDKIRSHGTLPPIADHEGIFVHFHCVKEQQSVITKSVYDFRNIDEIGLRNYIKSFDFDLHVFSKPVAQQAEAISDILILAQKLFVPMKEITIKTNDQPWVNSYTRILMRKKNRNYRIFKKVNSELMSVLGKQGVSEEIETRLREKKNRASKKARASANSSTKANLRAKNAFFNTVNATMKNYDINAKKKFSILTKLMKNQKNSSIPPLIQNGEVIDDSKLKSEQFNNLFTGKAIVNGSQDDVPLLPQNESITSSLGNINTSPIEVSKVLRQLKKSNSSHCGISGKFINIIATPISFCLSRVFNNCFEIGYFPEVFKIAHVTALWKRSGLKSDPSMYRPIALLPTLSKAAESIIHNRLSSHFLENNIITSRQAAYVKGDSTTHQLLYIVNLIRKSWTKGCITQGIFLDVSAAFDKCWHKGLLAKLKQVKVESSCYFLFESYLSNRIQCTVVDGVKSKFQEIKAGIPQGSKLGPLLWLLYVNDIIDGIESEILLFADDTCCFATGIDPAETAMILNRDLEKLKIWASRWKVTFNPSKSKDIIFSEKKVLFNSPPLVLDNFFVERVHEHKHLGIYLSSTLCWNRQVYETCLRANRKLAVLRSIKYLKRSTLDLLYKVCVRSTIEYGLVLYWHTLKPAQKAQISRIQYRGAKICSGALHFTSQLRLEQDLSWESIDSRARFLGLSIFHKIHLGAARPLIKSCMPEINSNNTRSSGLYKKIKYFSQKYNNSFFPLFSEYWSKLGLNLRSEQDILLFKENLKPSFKPKRQKHYAYGDKHTNALHCRLRVGRSFLKSHSFAINMSPSDRCLCGEIDTIQSYFFHVFCSKTRG
jgi:hypothetical protein